MVSLLLSFPVYQNGKILYLSVPVGYRLWDKETSKLALAADLVAQARYSSIDQKVFPS